MTWSTLIKRVLLDDFEMKSLSEEELGKILKTVIESARSNSGNYVKEQSKNEQPKH